jgi:hypothetical protein
VGSSETLQGWEGKEFNIGFEGSQALPVCPSGFTWTALLFL